MLFPNYYSYLVLLLLLMEIFRSHLLFYDSDEKLRKETLHNQTHKEETFNK